MIIKLIKETQQFINKPFTYEKWLDFESNKLAFMLKDFFISKTDDIDFNSMFDTLDDLNENFKLLDGNIICSESVNKIFNYNKGLRLNQ